MRMFVSNQNGDGFYYDAYVTSLENTRSMKLTRVTLQFAVVLGHLLHYAQTKVFTFRN